METYQGGLIYWPACVVAMVTEASIGIIGDSINHGQNSSADPGGDKSVIARSVGLVCGYVNLGQSNSEAAAPGVVRVIFGEHGWYPFNIGMLEAIDRFQR